jgi:hypothetical protein
LSGYTPVFRSIFEGTLCGQYPDTAAWLFMLALADKNGHVDKTPQYISAVTGMPVAELVGCIERFMQPDEHSRTASEDGRRLVLIDSSRSWGWRIVNHEKYREKARLAAKSAREAEDGRNAERLRDRRRPPVTAGDPLSNANANTNAGKESEGAKAPAAAGKAKATRIPDDWTLTPDLAAYAEAQLPNVDARKLAEAFTDYWRAAAGEKARKVDWDATWRTWVRRSIDRYPMLHGATAVAPVIRIDANGRQISG